GPARDWDVFIDETLHRMPAHLPKELSLAAMDGAAQALRGEAHATLRAALQNPRYTRLQLRLGLLLAGGDWRAANGIGGSPGDQPAMQFAGAVLDKRYKRIHKLGGKHADLGEDDLHRLRLLCKKLRYVAEFFRALYSRKAAKRYIAALAAIQDRLGSLNDAVVSRELLRQLEQRIAASDNSFTAMRVTALVLGWQAARIDHDLVGFRELWRDFRTRAPFWR
ncbi:MAG: CHAD domain-containing protein, partial [Dongiaceae bacterium]